MNNNECAFQRLTHRQNEIAKHLATGKRYKDVAYDLCISENTVRTHVLNIYRLLGITKKRDLRNLFT